MGLLALLLVGGLPLIDVLSSQPAASLWSVGTAIRLGFAVCNILLLENLYFNTPSDARWHINLLCVALGGLFLYDLVLYSDAALFHRVSEPLFEGRASATALAAPLIAIAAARNRRWAIDIHVSRDVVFHTATLVVSGIFLLGLGRHRRDLPPRRRRMGLRRRSLADLRRRADDRRAADLRFGALAHPLDRGR